ncbi:class I SAM-dependent methyltransferase [Roseovarius salinarum]|uniref:class I SAM-dependent methyltransferase n=1 Tax=Roseovarius salinarum TaxID=1981892 RepID=UPI000C31D9F8|nr:class I SAM-dependent methyltransferase [Roseovarius salinarum]
MPYFLDDYDDIRSAIPSYLHGEQASLLMYIMSSQTESGLEGNLMEIGVATGHFLALMQRFRQPSEKVIRIDPFYIETTSRELVQENLLRTGASDGVEVRKSRSDAIPIETYQQDWSPIRFCHVDGSHQAKDVVNDISICDRSVSHGGLIVLDDFMNPGFPGVAEGFFRYFIENEREVSLVPVGFCRGKLLLSFREYSEWYMCSIPDDHIAPRRSALFMARWVVTEARDGRATC